MADGDEQFRLGVEHGYNDEPVYHWQERFHQERYDAGYDVGCYQRVVQLKEQYGQRWDDPSRLPWDEFCRRMQRRGYDRDR